MQSWAWAPVNYQMDMFGALVLLSLVIDNICEGGAWPFLVGGVICLVNSVNERDLNLLNSYT